LSSWFGVAFPRRMARPPLVEEGVPIGSTLGVYGHHCEEDDDDEAMIAMELDQEGTTGGGRHHHQIELLADEDRPPIDSSLMRAVGGKIRIKQRRTTNRTVIGGDTAVAGAEPVDDYYDHHQSFPSLLPPSATQPHHSYHDPYHPSWTQQQQQQHQERPAVGAAEIPAPYRHAPAAHRRPRRIVIGQPDDDEPEDISTVARMEGVEDHSLRQPLVVLDGANVAYGYNDDLLLVSPAAGAMSSHNPKGRPNVRGILVAAEYWRNHHVRVLVVLPQPWLNNDPDMAVLLSRLPRSMFVAAPSRDDDDAYALQIAQRENSRARAKSSRNGGVEGPAYVVSNDMFRDAQERDGGRQLAAWLNTDDAVLGKGRISYTFANLGRRDDHGDVELDYLPNPRHPLVIWAEQQPQHQTP
jgi:hypothetical protein